jgi:hypothetical protein
MRLIRRIEFVLLRIGVVLLELIGEALLLGVLFGLLVAPKNLPLLVLGALPVILVLFLNGYYFTRPILGFLWTGARPWLYASIASALFTVHMYIGFAALRPDMSQVSTGVVVTFFVGGASIVFSCAFVGERWLREKRAHFIWFATRSG